MAEKDKIQEQTENQLESGTYEIIQARLKKQGDDLRARLVVLNDARKDVFGSIETKLIANERITTENTCIPSDMLALGDKFLFGYNVNRGLRKDMNISDVFSIFEYKEHHFKQIESNLLADKMFIEDFANLYNYYKSTYFVKFAVIGVHLFMVFRIGKGLNDIKTFKWLILEENENQTIKYLNNRSDHEYIFPDQHEFIWKRPTREDHRAGKHPHISIEDKVFVETTEGDLTIKVDNNTDSGKGIYSEDVDNKDQTLDDAEFYYSIIGNLIVLKIRPYQEQKFRYFVYNQKIQQAKRIDALEDSCVLLPDDHGIIFANGYYLQNGESKFFDLDNSKMMFEKRVSSPNGEDFMYAFYNPTSQSYMLLLYNLIEQKVATPIACNGFTIFENGEMCYFRTNSEAQKHHAIQIWQTPYVAIDYDMQEAKESFLFKVGNKDIVRAMAECTELINLINKEDSYSGLYLDLVKKSTDILDTYYWLSNSEAAELNIPIGEINKAASSAIDEFEKVIRIKKNTNEQVQKIITLADELVKAIKRRVLEKIDEFVFYLAELRKIRGELISLKDLRYVNLKEVEFHEKQISEQNTILSQATVEFLLKNDALNPYKDRVEAIRKNIDTVDKVIEANKIEQNIEQVSQELEMLIDIVSNLKIEDATQTTRIIDNISTIYSSFNQIRANLRRKRQELQTTEGKAEFNAQIKLISQGVINYLDLCDAPEKTDEYLTKLMVQLEELEGKFSEFNEFVELIASKREEIYDAFESRKISLIEARNRKADSLYQSADRILKAISNRVSRFKTVAEINGYYASDLMIEKLRELVNQLIAISDSVKADEIQSRLKTIKEDTIRQLKDKNELFVLGENIIQFGKHNFSVNTQKLGLTTVFRDNSMYYHLTGTGLFEKIENEEFNNTQQVWSQAIISENQTIYRAEYLAYLVYNETVKSKQIKELCLWTHENLQDHIHKFMAVRYNEGYIKGIHDFDAALILQQLLNIRSKADLLYFSPSVRALAEYFWQKSFKNGEKTMLSHQMKALGIVMEAFPDSKEYEPLVLELSQKMQNFTKINNFQEEINTQKAAEYLFYEISRGDSFVVDSMAVRLMENFQSYLKENQLNQKFLQSLRTLSENDFARYMLIKSWITAYFNQIQNPNTEYINEIANLLFFDNLSSKTRIEVALEVEILGFQGTHHAIAEQKYKLKFNEFIEKLQTYEQTIVPVFEKYTELKKQLIANYEKELRLNEFTPRVLSSFVRNQLIDKLYLPLIGTNLAKQIGTAGENKRTDLMGLLLLISPPGYGKTTIMEYIANRLGIIFMKINGPAIGHQVTSVDPKEAPNATAAEELQKLNLAFEMGDNVMIYLDDIQHCNPEFLQKFISFSDAQRKIEGVYKGRTKTYDFRGKKVCLVMAGNPYTESGDKFKIPDMLANRADIYNLGDIIGDTADVFNLSYIENSLTANSILAKLAGKSQKDVYTLVKIAETGNKDGLDFEASHSPEEITEYVEILKKMIRVRDIISLVNQEYIASAAQQEQYRTEPAFKLQGSYRNMNKLAEKLMPIMNDKELETLILSHYESESQTLTSSAEANLLKFKEITNKLSEVEKKRWHEIKEIFMREQKMKGFGQNAQIAGAIEQMLRIANSLEGIKSSLSSVVIS